MFLFKCMEIIIISCYIINKYVFILQLIEAMLFTMYPAVNLVLIAWLLGSAISPLLAPYTLLVLG